MATWTYSDYITETSDSERLTKLRQHIHEVSERLSEELSGGGQAISTNNLSNYLKDLKAEEKELNVQVNQATRGGGLVGIRRTCSRV